MDQSVICVMCGQQPYRPWLDGADEDNFGSLAVKNKLGITVEPDKYRAVRCPGCGHIQIFRITR